MSQRLFRQKALQKLASPEQLDQLMSITTPRRWFLLLGLAGLLLTIIIWSVLATVPTTLDADGVLLVSANDPDRLEVVLYLSVWDGTRVKPGMDVNISPVSATKNEYGMLKGRVLSADHQLSSMQDMIQVLGSDMLAGMFFPDNKFIKVQVQLEKTKDTPSGYRWTSADGPPFSLEHGTLCNAVIILDRERPIDLVFSR
jgi:hypothetical protein